MVKICIVDMRGGVGKERETARGIWKCLEQREKWTEHGHQIRYGWGRGRVGRMVERVR